MQPAPRDIPCLDIWPLSKLNQVIIRTYRNLDRMQKIVIQYPIRVVGGKVSISYLADIPQEWAREGIKEAAEQIRRGLERERDKLEAELARALEVGISLAEIQAIQGKYTEINDRLEV